MLFIFLSICTFILPVLIIFLRYFFYFKYRQFCYSLIACTMPSNKKKIGYHLFAIDLFLLANISYHLVLSIKIINLLTRILENILNVQ